MKFLTKHVLLFLECYTLISLFWPILFAFGPIPFSARGTNSDQLWCDGIMLDALYQHIKMCAKIIIGSDWLNRTN